MAEAPLPSGDPRVPLAAERTLLAWVRTGLGLMGFGFVVARLGLFLQELAVQRDAKASTSPGLSLAIGTALIVAGVLVQLLAARQHVRRLRAFAAGASMPAAQGNLAVGLAVVLAVLGLGLAVYVGTMGR
jgi:putative membrane protein